MITHGALVISQSGNRGQVLAVSGDCATVRWITKQVTVISLSRLRALA